MAGNQGSPVRHAALSASSHVGKTRFGGVASPPLPMGGAQLPQARMTQPKVPGRQTVQPGSVQPYRNHGVVGGTPVRGVPPPNAPSGGANLHAAHLQRLAQAKLAQPPGVYRPGVHPGILPAAAESLRPPQPNGIGRTDASLKAAVQPKSVVQLVQCGFCLSHSGHKPTCRKYVAPAKKTARKGTHTPGNNHDDGSGFQRSGAGGDRHQAGLRNQIVNANQNNFYRKKKKKP